MKSHSRNLKRTSEFEGYGNGWGIAWFLCPMGNPSGINETHIVHTLIHNSLERSKSFEDTL